MSKIFPYLWHSGLLALALALSAACGGSNDAKSGGPASAPDAAPAATAAPKAAVESASLWMSYSEVPGAGASLEAAASLKNNTSSTLKGIEANVEVVDAAGKMLSSRPFKAPAIGAGETYVYLAQGSTVSISKLHTVTWDAPGGKPASLRLVVTSPGSPVQTPGDMLPAKDVRFTQGAKPGTYEVTGTVTNTGPIAVTDIGYKSAVLWAADGSVAGVGFGSLDTAGQPRLIPAGTPLKYTAIVEASKTPARAEVNIYAEK